MDMNELLDITWVSLLAFAISLGYAVVLLTTKSAKVIVGKKNIRPIKNEEKYATEAGKLLLSFAIASLVMSGILLVNIPAAIAEIVLVSAVVMVRWRKITEMYGPL